MRYGIPQAGQKLERAHNKQKKDGTLYQEEVTFSTVKDSSGDILNYVAIKRDITEQLRLESIAEAVNTMNNIGYVFAGSGMK